LLVRLGKKKLCPTAQEIEYLELTVTPKYFDNGELEPLSVYQIAFLTSATRRRISGGRVTLYICFQETRVVCMTRM
jgi:hypothetical protein